MNLHNNFKLYSNIIKATSQYIGINELFIEKDYWITYILYKLAKSEYANKTVFKGGTSLSKGFGLINRFSEDVDIALKPNNNLSGNQMKNLIKSVEGIMTKGLNEIYINGVTRKGSKYRKSVFEYISINKNSKNNKLILEINSFANPFPYKTLRLKSLVNDFLIKTNNKKYIGQFNLQSFKLNVLNKEQTLIEKLVSLIRFSFDNDPINSVSKRIRHFYDLYFLMNDKECLVFLASDNFNKQFNDILNHDRLIFNEPSGWESKAMTDSPLLINFDKIWIQLKDIYTRELSALAFSQIPDETKIADNFNKLIKFVI